MWSLRLFGSENVSASSSHGTLIKHARAVGLLAFILFLTFVVTGCANKTTKEATETRGGGQASAAPSGEQAKQVDRALVRFVNATATPKDLYFGDAAVVHGAAFRAATPYRELPAERHDFKLFAAGNTSEVLATNSEGLTAGKHYTILAVDQKDGKPALNAINDDLAEPSAGRAKVRVINAAPALADVDLYGADRKSALISGAGFNHATDYKDIEPTTTELVVRDAANKHRQAVLQNVRLEAGKLYTLLVVGGKGAHLTAETIEDQLVPPSPRT